MRQILIRVFLICLVVLFQNNAIAHEEKKCKEMKQIISNFLNSKKEIDWYKIESSSLKYQFCKCELSPVFYFEHWFKIALPNSQSLVSIDPNDFVIDQKKQLKKQLRIMKNCSTESFLPLIEVMKKQQFDITMKKSAENLKKRLFR